MPVCLSPNGRDVYSLEAPPRQLMAGTADGISVLERPASGEAWTVAERALEGCHISALLWESRRGGLFAGVHKGGLYASLDSGRTWERKTRGLTEEDLYSLAAAERDGQVVLYAGTEPAHLFESADYGESWQEVVSLLQVPDTNQWTFPSPPHIPHVKDITFAPGDSRVMYISVEQGALLKSTDGGQTWRELSGYYSPDDETYKDVHRVDVDPSNADKLYQANGLGLYFSPDGGETWERLTARGSARIGYPDALLISPYDSKTLFTAGALDSPGTWRSSHFAEACIARSRDGGRTWRELRGGLPEHMRGNVEAMSMGIWPGGYSLFAGTTDGDMFLSEDEGERWSQIASGLAPVSKGTHYVPLGAVAR